MTKAIAFFMLLLGFGFEALVVATAAHASETRGYVDLDLNRKEAIIFVHGVTGDAVGTWTNEKSKAYWPSVVRNDSKFSRSNVWVFNYESPRISNAQNIEELARKLGDEMRADGVFERHERVYFLAHSMGGLIVREMLTQVLPPPDKVPMIYFFGTPSAGAELAGVVAAVSENPQFANMRPFTRESAVASLSRHWLATAEMPAARYPQRVLSFCAYEVEGLILGRLIVGSLSASFLCNTSPRAVVANHVAMVKPESMRSEAYLYFASAYEFVHGEAAQLISLSSSTASLTQLARPIDVTALQVKSERIDRQYFAVDCDQTRRDDVPINVLLTAQERIVAAQAVVDSTSNLQRASFEAYVDLNGLPRLRYDVGGLPRTLFNCPGGGNAHVSVKYVVENR